MAHRDGIDTLQGGQAMDEATPQPDDATADTAHRNGLWVYLLVSFGLAWALELGPVRALGLTGGNKLVMLPMVAVMFCPLIAALIARKVEGGGFGDAGLRWGRWGYLLVAWLLPVGLSVVASGLTMLLGLGQWDPTAASALQRIAGSDAAAAESARRLAQQVGAWLPVVAVAQGLVAGVAITSIATFGEEFGWRGYLQMRLERFGVLRSCLLTGLIWGVWHVPIIAQGHNYPGYPVAGSLLFIVFCTLLSVILGWLRNASGSVLAPTIAHASVNSPAASLMAFVPANVLTGNLLGAVGTVVMAAVCVWIVATGRLRRRVDEELARRQVAGREGPSGRPASEPERQTESTEP